MRFLGGRLGSYGRQGSHGLNSGERTVHPPTGLNGWNLSWADWQAGSAVR
ncbi:hypothetical protein AB0958_26555 [Streptomyces sp. NPDC006655]